MRSEVFENYINIMSEKGFIEKEAEAQTRVEKETDPDYRDKIMALYGLDIDLNDSNKSIVEQAHPDKVIIAPSYDRVNGLVENIQERHDIMVGIVTKPSNGNLTQHRYAQKELLDELVRLGFSLDNAGEEGLSKLADECSIRLTTEMSNHDVIKKEAFGWLSIIPLIPKIVMWGGALAGVMMAKQHLFGTVSQGVAPDTENAIAELTTLAATVGSKDRAVLTRLIRILNLFKAKTAEIAPILSSTEGQQVESLDSPQDISGVRVKVKATQIELQKLKKYLEICSALANHLNSMEGQIRAMDPQQSAHENEWLYAVKQVWEGVAGSDSSDAANATDALEDSLVDFVNKYSAAMSEGANQARERSNSVTGELQGLLGGRGNSGQPGQNEALTDIPGILQGLFR